MLIAELVRFLGINNCRARVVSTSHIAEIESTISHLGQSQSIDAAFYTELTGYYDFDCNAALPYARSIIITASFQPPARAFFDGHAVIIPPTYIYTEILHKQLELVTDFLEPLGYRIARARLPLKTLAVRSGLGKYGRNNICYIPGMGSFFRLGAFYCDMPCEEDGWKAPEVMKSCLNCKTCADKCPAGCISTSSFVIQADRCLTHFNENEKPFPTWVKPEWHNALLGCMICQESCPVNQRLLNKTQDTGVSFSKTETDKILCGTAMENLGAATVSKLKSLCLYDSDIYPLLKRNLSLLLNK